MITSKIVFMSNGYQYPTLAKAIDAEEGNFNEFVKTILLPEGFTHNDCYKITVAFLKKKEELSKKLSSLNFEDSLNSDNND